MDSTRFFAALQLAQLRFNSDPSDRNKEVLDQAQQDYDFVCDPEKKTEGEQDSKPTPTKPVVVDVKSAPKPTPLKEGEAKPGTKKPEAPKQPAAPTEPVVIPDVPSQTEAQPGTDNQDENQENQEKVQE